MPSQRVLEAVLKVDAILDRVWKLIPESFVLNTDRERMCLGLFDLASEHLHCMCQLLGDGHRVGSAFALARPVVEACYRMHYLIVHEGSQLHEELMRGDRSFPELKKIVSDVEGHYKMQGTPDIFNQVEQHRNFLNAMTHGGREQILARYDEAGHLKSSYPDRSQIQIIKTALGHFLLATVALIGLFYEEDEYHHRAGTIVDIIGVAANHI